MFIARIFCAVPVLSTFCTTIFPSFVAEQAVLVSRQSVLAGWSWEDCGTQTELVAIKSIEISPSPPVPGNNMTVTVVAEAFERIEEGAYADVYIKIGAVQVAHKKYDLCELADKYDVGVTCPVEPDAYTMSRTLTMPQEVPRTRFDVQAFGYTVDEDIETVHGIERSL